MHQPCQSEVLPRGISRIRRHTGACLFSLSGLLSARSTRRLGIPLTEIRLRSRSGILPRFTDMHRVAFDKRRNTSLADAIRHDLAGPPLELNVFGYYANRNSYERQNPKRGAVFVAYSSSPLVDSARHPPDPRGRLVRPRRVHNLGAVTRPPTGVLLLHYRGADPAVCASGSSRESVHSGRWRRPATPPVNKPDTA